MSTINKMCCLSVVVFSYDMALARSFLDSYIVQDHHFNDVSPTTEYINNDVKEPSITYDLWVLGA